MKPLFQIISLLWIAPWWSLNSQSTHSFEYLFEGGFFSQIYDAAQLNSGKWVLIAQNDSTSGITHADSLSIVFLDNHGKYEKSLLVDTALPSNRLVFEWLKVLPNDEIIVGYAIGECDVLSATLKLVKFDSIGNVIWEQKNLPIHSPVDIHWSEDHGILTFEENRVYSLSEESGEMAWEIIISNGHFSGGAFTSYADDILYFDHEGVYFAKLDSIEGELKYVIQATRDIAYDADFLNYLQSTSTGSLYTYSSEYGGIIRISQDLDITVLIPLSTSPGGFIADTSGLWVLRHDYEDITFQISRFDTIGLLLYPYKSEFPGKFVTHLKKVDQDYVLIGSYGSGTYFSNVATQEHAWRTQAWVEYASMDALFISQDSFNLSVTGVIQDGEIHIESEYSPFPLPGGYYHTFEGGDFTIQVTNTGSGMVDNCWINTGFKPAVLDGDCGTGPFVKEVFYSGLNLQPGESIWLHFGNIYARDQEDFPSEFCFWTSGPNASIDIYPNDDTYCSAFIVPVTEPGQTSLKIFPNPASDKIHFQTSNQTDVKEWKIFNLQGMVICSGNISAEQTSHSISVFDLSPGLYVLQVGNVIEKVVVTE
jgi:outer membrane protein assembly factor BamB